MMTHVVREPRVLLPTWHVNPGFQKLMGPVLLRRLCSILPLELAVRLSQRILILRIEELMFTVCCT